MNDPIESLQRSVRSLTEELLTVYEMLHLLQSLGPRLGRLGGEDQILAAALAEALETVQADCGWVALWDGDQPRAPAVRGLDRAAAEHISQAALAPLHFRNKRFVLSHAFAEEHGLAPETAPQRFLAGALAASGASFGYLCAGRRSGGRNFTSADQKLLTAVASLLAVELENARLRRAEMEKARLETELELASSFQRSLQPRDFGCCGFLEADGLSVPCQQVGGDYFDLLPMSDEACLLVIADVFGKGPAAAMQAAMLQGLVHATSRHCRQVGCLLDILNGCLRARACAGSYVTAFLAIVDRCGGLRYINGGHHPPLWIRRDGTVLQLSEGGPLVGWLEHPHYEEGAVELAPGDTVLLYTDGVTEAANPSGETFGAARLLEWAARQAGASPSQIRTGLLRAVEEFSGGRPNDDDLALLAVRFTGAPR